MTHVATLICNPVSPALDAAALERARTALPHAGAPSWLDPGIAADIPFTPDAGGDQRLLANQVQAALRNRLSFETLVSGLSATFAKLRGAEVGRGIEEGLRRVGEHLGADRATITRTVRDGDAIEAVHVWHRPGAAPPSTTPSST